MVLLAVFPNVKQRGGRGQKGGNFARQVLSIMIRHPVPGSPHSGREEKTTITVINEEEGLVVTAQ